MTYKKWFVALYAMAAWAEHSTAPAIGIVYSDGVYRIAESDEKGVFIISHAEEVVEMMWTQHSSGVTEFTIMNAYSVSCCYNVVQINEQTIRVPHGTKDLASYLDQAILQAHENAELFRSCHESGRTYIDAISEGDGVCPYRDGLPIPENWTEEGPRPVVVFKTVGDKFDRVIVPRGDAHVIVVDEEKGETGRWSLEELQGQIGPLKIHAVRVSDTVDLLHGFADTINRFDLESQATNSTDTDIVWQMLNEFRDRIVKTVGEPPKRSFS